MFKPLATVITALISVTFLQEELYVGTKHKAARSDVHTNLTSSRLDVIRSIYGIAVVGILMETEAADNWLSGLH
ncbi:hypothetical protein TanjilG_29918 [Lupinus angustifolius]|uniref:Uncharacterized protein n=1 Tax=Lupinus angustifolius TaxID=3871 RepID=A0A1J7GP03_LUPAN|nr:hypothetical protein TanjilG_29918 [Lupinus angustifolius]